MISKQALVVWLFVCYLAIVLAAAWLLSGCSSPSVIWHPPSQATWHIRGSYPGPNEYDEIDTPKGLFPLEGHIAFVYTEHTSTPYFEDTEMAYIYDNGHWDKFMNCKLAGSRLACTDMAELGFMPDRLYDGETWTSRLTLGMGDKQHHTGEQTITHHVRSYGSGFVIDSNAVFADQKLTLKYQEQYDADGQMIAQDIFQGERQVASARRIK